MKKKLRAEANKVSAEAEQEGARADGLNLENIRNLLDLQGEQLVASEQRNKAISTINDELRAKMEEYDDALTELKNQVREMEKRLNETLGRAEYAEENLCTNTGCRTRKPKLGTFKP